MHLHLEQRTFTLTFWQSIGLGEYEVACDYYYLGSQCLGSGPLYYTGRSR